MSIYIFAVSNESMYLNCTCMSIVLQGLDLPKSNNPREVVQSIMFKQHTTVLGKEAMDVVSNLFRIFDFKIILQMCLNSKSKLSNCIVLCIAEEAIVTGTVGRYVVEH